jgi:DNA topoisomerase VI subunit B
VTARQTTTRKKAARKKATAKKTTRKKAAKKTARKKLGRIAASDLLGAELPKSLKALSRQLRRDLNAIERQIQTARKETRRSLTRVVRDASHHLGTLEARGQKEWRKMSSRARSEVERTLKRVKRATQKK